MATLSKEEQQIKDAETKDAIMQQITEYIDYCYDNNIRSFRTKVKANYNSYKKSDAFTKESSESQIVTDLKNSIANTTNEDIKKMLNDELKKQMGDRSDLRQRYGRVLSRICMNNGEYAKLKKSEESKKKKK